MASEAWLQDFIRPYSWVIYCSAVEEDGDECLEEIVNEVSEKSLLARAKKAGWGVRNDQPLCPRHMRDTG